MTRDKVIAVSDAEKQKLDDVAAREFGQDGCAYGAIINFLVNRYYEDN